ncbi:class I SAM-dependent methyltransferase [Limnochorda pilosa]|uniref:Methyltransferase domain-containing protein n=1 Tax=Limnochorda pilosa TaxID=1555112 RepID=A0A0K2SH01_LIMPI|nr:class I SAM-dependent methyltransferase [Limnochorda pilosa]BAS26307.1 hypothetical protein LIP_0450 [Limnochorda pilosa]
MYDREMRHVDWDEVFRRQVLRSAEVERWLDALALRADGTVADVGSGPGYVTLRAAARLGPGGCVFAVDRREEALAYLRHKLAEDGQAGERGRVETVVSDAESFTLPQAVDAALVTHMLHHTDQPRRVLDAVLAALAPGGLAVVAEFDPEAPGEVGPPPAERIPRPELETWLREAGFELQGEVPSGVEQYALLVRRPEHRAG